MKELGIAMNFKSQTIDDITLQVIASAICKNNSPLHMRKLNNSSAKQPISTQCTNIFVGRSYSVQYKDIFGTPDKGQMLYVQEGQTIESGLRCWIQHLIEIWGGRATTSSPHHHQDAVLHSYVEVRYWTDQTRQI